MIATMKYSEYSCFVLATPDDWGLVENSVKTSNIGWVAKFVVNGKTYTGIGHLVSSRAALLLSDRKPERATKVVSISGTTWYAGENI